jgi:cytochrome c-type biogenesis protein CcmE
MTRKYKFGVGAVLLAGAIGYLMYAGVQQSSLYYVTMEEFAARQESLVDQAVRVAGRVSAGSVQKRTSEKGTELNFSIGDFVEGGETNGGPLLRVEYTGIVPDMFAEGRDVIIEGTYADGVLRAQTVMTSCPSKYEPATAEAEARAGNPVAVD